MRQFRLLALVASLSILGALAIGASSASATVLCKKASANDYCGAEYTYPQMTEIKASLAAGTKATLTTGTGINFGRCSVSNLRFGIAKTGGLNEWTTVGFNEFSFSSCDANRQINTNQITAGDIAWIEGTNDGEMTQDLLIENPATPIGGHCAYWVEEGGRFIGGSSPQIVFNGVPAVFDSGTTYLCPKTNMTFSATYNISSPTPIYVEKY